MARTLSGRNEGKGDTRMDSWRRQGIASSFRKPEVPLRRWIWITIAVATAALAACDTGEPENIQAKAENVANMLENRAEEIAAEAENVTDEAVGALENETANFANRADALTGDDGDGDEAKAPANKQ